MGLCIDLSAPSSGSSSLSEDTILDLQYILEENYSDICSSYVSYVRCIRNSIEEKGISVDDLRSYLYADYCRHFSGVELERATTLCRIFDIIREYTSFLNYKLFQCIIKEFGINPDQDALKYPDHLEAYIKKLKISEFIKINPRLAESHESKKLILKVDIKVTCPLSQVIELKRETARIFKLMPSAIQLYSIEDGCIVVTFHIPALVADLILERCKKLAPNEKKKIWSFSVFWLECDGNRFHFQKEIPKMKLYDSHFQEIGHEGNLCTIISGKVHAHKSALVGQMVTS